jgi:heptaprenyl diphosphate synthase
MSKSVKHLVMLAMFTTMALTIFVVEAQIPIPVPIYGVKVGWGIVAILSPLIVLVVYRPRDAFAVLVMRILLGSLFTGTLVSMIYSLSGGILCFLGMALLCRLLHRKHLWFISMIGAVLHNVGQIAAAIVVMQSVQVIVYFPFLLVSGCITGIFTGIAADRVVHFLPRSIFPKENLPEKKNEQSK